MREKDQKGTEEPVTQEEGIKQPREGKDQPLKAASKGEEPERGFCTQAVKSDGAKQ